MWNAVQNEIREVLWLTSVVSGVSVLAVGFAVALAAALVLGPN